MPVSVQVPVRVVVDPQALMSRLEDLDEAVEAATTRALTNAVAAIEERRGSYVTHRAADPVVSWRGDGLPDVSRERVGEAEARVREALSRAVAATMPAARSDGDGSLAERLTADPSEIIDPRRLAVIAGLYAVPGYRDGEAEVVPVDAPVTADSRPSHLEWRPITGSTVFWAAFGKAVAGRGPLTGQVGVIFRDARPGVQICVWQLPEKTVIFPITLISGGTQLRPEVSGTSTQIRRDAYGAFPPGAAYRLRYLGPGQTEADRRASLRIAYERIFAPVIREDVRRMRPLATEAELAGEVDARLTQFIDGLAASEPATTCYLELLIDGDSVVLPCPHEVAQDLDAELISLVEQVEGATEGGAGDGSGGGEGSGTGEGAAAGGEGGTGDGSADGGTADGGGPVLEFGEGTGGSLFPPSAYASSGEYDCCAFNGEPALGDLGADGEILGRLIAEIAADLQMPVCAHAARFCLNAALAIEVRARSVGDHAEGSATFTQSRSAVSGAAGVVIVPVASPAVLLLRHLASVVPKITRLRDVIGRIYSKDEVFARMGGPWNDSPASWHVHFLLESTPPLTRSVGRLFVRTCQVVLLQSLRASADAIAARIDSEETYLPVFKKLILGFVLGVEELDVLHDRLEAELDESTLRAAGREAFTTWQDAKNALGDVLAGRDPLATDDQDEGEFVRRDGAVVAIRDWNGNVWSLDQLRRALELRRGSAIGFDPLVGQIIDDDELLGRFRRNPDRIGEELSTLLEEMRLRNEEITREVRSSDDTAFGYARIYENLYQRTVPGTSVALQGIHRQAHEQIGEFFRGDPVYSAGLNRLFNTELGYQSLTTFFEVVGVTALAVLCPPVGTAVGVPVAAYHVTEALEREHLFRSLINPEAVITRAEVETDLFLAELEAALVFLPNAKSIVRDGGAAARTVGRDGIVAGTASLRGGLSASVARALENATAAHIMKTIVEEQIEDKLLDILVFQPLSAAVQQEFGAAPPPGSPIPGQAPETRTFSRRGGGAGSTHGP